MPDSSRPTSTTHDLARRRRNFRAESSRAALYRQLSELSEAGSNPRLAGALRRLSELEKAQADYWASLLPADQRPVGARYASPLDARDRLLLQGARHFGTRVILPVLAKDALRGAEAYRTQTDAAPALPTELEVASEAARLAGVDRAAIDVGRDHRRQPAAANGSLRAAVFGVNDGLVSNLSLVMGVAGAAPPQEFILLAGLAGLLAGAFSMAAGEFISMLSQRELLERQLEIERLHIALAPDAERAVLARRYQDKGIPGPQAEEIAQHVMADPETALDTIAREQLGLDPEELGSPGAAALASFVSFAFGAVLPVLPFLLLSGWLAVVASGLLSAGALFLVGIGVSVFTGRRFLFSGLRMLAVGAAAAAVTFLIGRLIGVSVAG